MALISVTNPNDGETVDASDVANPINTIVNAINGNLDSTNISSLSGTKITNATLSSAAFDANAAKGWTALSVNPNTVTYNGNRSYTCVFNSTDLTGIVSNGMRVRFTRSVVAPTQCTSLNGTTQYYSKTSPAGMTFTDDFTVSAWVKLTSYAQSGIISRFNGTSGWIFRVESTGQLTLAGFNAGAGNYSLVATYQSIPLNKWVHVAAQLDMSTFTATTTTSYMMIDGVDVPASVTRGGTNPTALVQAGNLEIGSYNAGAFFPGKLAQVAIYSAKVTQATIQASISQGLAGTETSLISAYSFNNSINDLNANANNLTANGSAVATNADSPFAQGATAGTLEYGIITSNSFSTNTTLTVQVPEGSAIPTTGGITAVSYSPHKAPYGFPADKDKWLVQSLYKVENSQGSAAASTYYNISSARLSVPVGNWDLGYQGNITITATDGGNRVGSTLSTTSSSITDDDFSTELGGSSVALVQGTVTRNKELAITSSTPYYLLVFTSSTAGSATLYLSGFAGSRAGSVVIKANFTYL